MFPSSPTVSPQSGWRTPSADGLSSARTRDDVAAGHAVVSATLCREHFAAIPRACAVGGQLAGARAAVHEQHLAGCGHSPGRFLAEDEQVRKEIHQTLQKKFKKFVAQELAGEEPMESLDAWANSAPLAGEVAVAAIYLSRYNDRYYGQCVLMNVPFRSLDDLYRPELELVPPHLYYQTLALLLRPDHWTSEEPSGPSSSWRHVRNILAMLFANQGLIRRYLSGELNKNEDLHGSSQDAQERAGNTDVDLSRKQQRIADELVEAVQQGVNQKQQRENAWKVEEDWVSKDAADMEEEEPPAGAQAASPFAAVGEARSAFAVLGPAGSGKTTAVHAATRRVDQAGGRILLTAPTGRLAATLRERFPELEVDTVHGAFLAHKPDLIVVEEVGQLSRAIFERIMEQRQAAELRQTLELLRVGKPTQQQLQQIKAGHKVSATGGLRHERGAKPGRRGPHPGGNH